MKHYLDIDDIVSVPALIQEALTLKIYPMHMKHWESIVPWECFSLIQVFVHALVHKRQLKI